MVSKFDQLDLKLIHQLWIDGRTSLTELAEKVGLSRQTVANRMKRLIDGELVIVKGGVNLRRFGFRMAHVGLEVKTDETRREVERYLKDCPRVQSVFRTPEKANLHFSIWGEDDHTINSTIESFRDRQNVEVVYTHSLGTPVHGNTIVDAVPTKNTVTPCGLNCSDCHRYSSGWCVGCPASSNYKNPILK